MVRPASPARPEQQRAFLCFSPDRAEEIRKPEFFRRPRYPAVLDVIRR